VKNSTQGTKGGEGEGVEMIRHRQPAPILLLCVLGWAGVDSDVLKNILDNASFEPLLAFPELADFIDQDPYISEVMRTKRGENESQ